LAQRCCTSRSSFDVHEVDRLGVEWSFLIRHEVYIPYKKATLSRSNNTSLILIHTLVGEKSAKWFTLRGLEALSEVFAKTILRPPSIVRLPLLHTSPPPLATQDDAATGDRERQDEMNWNLRAWWHHGRPGSPLGQQEVGGCAVVWSIFMRDMSGLHGQFAAAA
jgi:hypothetical protein